MRARGQMRSLRSSQISTHLGLDGRRRSPALPNATWEQRNPSGMTPPGFSSRSPSQGASIKVVAEEQNRYSLLEHQTADVLNVL